MTVSPLRPQPINPTDVLSKLRKKLKAIDTQPVVLSLQTPGTVPWTVQ